MSNNSVDVSEGDGFDVEQPTADPVDRVVLVHHDGVGQLVEMSQRQHRVVILKDHLKEKVGDRNVTRKSTFLRHDDYIIQICTSPVPYGHVRWLRIKDAG